MKHAMNSMSDPLESTRPHVLVVDDDPLFRSLMVSVLRHDFDVTVASDGADGFYRALEIVPAVAVLDIQMPGWDGIKTLKAMRSHPSLAGVKVIVLTSDASRETVLAAIQAGADDYIIKTSFSRDEFRRKLDCFLNQTPASDKDTAATTSVSEASNAADVVGGMVPELMASASTPAPAASWSGSEAVLREAMDSWE